MVLAGVKKHDLFEEIARYRYHRSKLFTAEAHAPTASQTEQCNYCEGIEACRSASDQGDVKAMCITISEGKALKHALQT